MIKQFEVKGSSIQGNGVHATQKIKRGEYITSFLGELHDSSGLLAALDAGKITPDDPLQIDEGLYLIIDSETRYFNHSCNPNAGIRHSNHLYAFKNIQIGEEITFDYSSTVGMYNKWRMSCACGHSSCRKKIGNTLTIPQDRLKAYLDFDLLPEFIKNQLQLTSRKSKQPILYFVFRAAFVLGLILGFLAWIKK